jgi:hypothetical protein
MTKDKFIKKWLGNKDYQYTEENRDLMRDDLDEVIKQALLIHNFSRSSFLIPIRWFEKMFCKHKNKTEIFRCYQEGYVSEVCNDCGKVIYSDL